MQDVGAAQSVSENFGGRRRLRGGQGVVVVLRLQAQK